MAHRYTRVKIQIVEQKNQSYYLVFAFLTSFLLDFCQRVIFLRFAGYGLRVKKSRQRVTGYFCKNPFLWATGSSENLAHRYGLSMGVVPSVCWSYTVLVLAMIFGLAMITVV